MATSLRERIPQDLQLAGQSERTQEAYLCEVRQLPDHFEVAEGDVRNWSGKLNGLGKPALRRLGRATASK